MEVTSHLTEKAQRDYLLVQQAINQGDQKAYAELLNNYRDSLYFMLLKMTNNPVDADDLTIEAFGKAFKNLHQYTMEFAFSTWLFRIASNNCIDFLRKKNRIQYTSGINPNGEETESYPSNLPSSDPGPDEMVIAKQKIQLMREVVEKLKPHYRNLVEMRYFRELSYEEIAVELDLPLGTVKAQLFRAREFLYQILKDSEEKI
ncbi:MAG TPA: sigma-70 family RNA polymerase sigma factor [Bacteroidales bacterium]|nr:sigma-70 family RNA polymerase sigma factor [Bacteroidales bacterium]